MKWVMKIQKLGRIQIPTKYLKAYNLKEGDIVIIEEKGNNLVLAFKRKKTKNKKRRKK
jgi:bifunctional DNA-binding transcriptional regulator/antitoxin component of YhaV-PrlF toxin-antitoxin module